MKDARKNKWNECMLCIERVNKYASYENLAEEIVEDAINDIKKLIDPSESLSAVAKACLLSSGHEWAKEIINTRYLTVYL
ncbi:hypothetical protein [Vallitalea guaymasensis]|uniref:Uncharacterized protein n=1 Tax=Vallitalea guaymasensis TaxID=1185412 RepID=A0A8J8SAX3_9FIRM|nr:hypothetical protein [Vallitalea guaymasensis]QUH27746.1 hypothetical protein HYG85_01965 [Vallitalea guaymasensis]